jgi:predicted transcriptional regulator
VDELDVRQIKIHHPTFMNDKEFLKQKIAEMKASNKELEAYLADADATSDNLADLLAELTD